MCATLGAAIRSVLNGYRVSRETWELIDAEQRKDLPPAWAETPADCPQLVTPATVEEIEAGERADEARRKIEDKITALFRQRAPRADNCGHGATMYMRRDAPDGNGIDEMLRKPGCKRSTCPHCWRLRICKTLRRACACLLDESNSEPGHRPRLGVLYVAEGDWLAWEATDKAIRRTHPGCVDARGKCCVGRLRVRRADNSLLIVCERPFRGARAMKPAEALDLAAAAIGELHPEKHSFRLLGAWSDHREKEWKVIARYDHLDLDTVHRELRNCGARVRRFRSENAHGLIWSAKSEQDADLLRSSCPSLPKRIPSSSQPNSDSGDATPFDPPDLSAEQVTIPDGFDPGGNPWRT